MARGKRILRRKLLYPEMRRPRLVQLRHIPLLMSGRNSREHDDGVVT